MKKYELTDEQNKEGHYRIRALRDFGIVNPGDLGGFVESEQNLSHEGDCWIFNNAVVYGNAVVYDNAAVYGHARVSGNAVLHGHARVFGNAVVYDHAVVAGHAKVYDRAVVDGHAIVYGRAKVSENANVYGHAVVSQDHHVSFSRLETDLRLRENLVDSIRVQTGLISSKHFIHCYKHVNPNLSSLYDPNFFYEIGKEISAENPDESNESCVPGLHFSHDTYWENNAPKDAIVLLCKVRLDDIITVQQGKIRARKCFVVDSIV